MNRRSVRSPVGRTRRPRRGVSLMVAVVLLAVTAAVLAAAVKTTALHRRAADADLRRARAELLADAAARLARGRRAADPAYRGETWSAATPAGPAAATIAPSDESAGDPAGGLRVTATVGAGGDRGRVLRRLPPDEPRSPPGPAAGPPRRPLSAPEPRTRTDP